MIFVTNQIHVYLKLKKYNRSLCKAFRAKLQDLGAKSKRKDIYMLPYNVVVMSYLVPKDNKIALRNLGSFDYQYSNMQARFQR